MSATGTIQKRFIGPGCQVRARDVADTLMEVGGFSVTAVSRAEITKPATWLSCDLEAHFSVSRQSSQEVLEIVKEAFPGLGWRLHHSST